MNKEDIIAMARDANPEHDLTAMLPFLSRFAALVAVREREKCATGIRRWLDAFKIAAGCVDCGYRAHPHALHFDHLGDKVLNVSYAKSLRQAKAEISKCEVRCANCHSIKTHERRQAHKSA